MAARLYPGFGSGKGVYEVSLKVNAVNAIGRSDLEAGDKVLLPASAFKEINRLKLPFPLTLQVVNDKAVGAAAVPSRTGKPVTDAPPEQYCGIMEFSAPEGQAYVPSWMLRNVKVREGGTLRFTTVRDVPTGTYVKLRPRDEAFVELAAAIGPRELLETALRNYSVLSRGERIVIDVADAMYTLDVCDVKPGSRISLFGTVDLEVDFEPVHAAATPTSATTPGLASTTGARTVAAPTPTGASSVAAGSAKPGTFAGGGGAGKVAAPGAPGASKAVPPAASGGAVGTVGAPKSDRAVPVMRGGGGGAPGPTPGKVGSPAGIPVGLGPATAAAVSPGYRPTVKAGAGAGGDKPSATPPRRMDQVDGGRGRGDGTPSPARGGILWFPGLEHFIAGTHGLGPTGGGVGPAPSLIHASNSDGVGVATSHLPPGLPMPSASFMGTAHVLGGGGGGVAVPPPMDRSAVAARVAKAAITRMASSSSSQGGDEGGVEDERRAVPVGGAGATGAKAGVEAGGQVRGGAGHPQSHVPSPGRPTRHHADGKAGDADTDGGGVDVDGMRTCPHCTLPIAPSNFILHTLRCRTNTDFHRVACPQCGLHMYRKDIVRHVHCPECTAALNVPDAAVVGGEGAVSAAIAASLKTHATVCPKRMVECGCGARMPAAALEGHQSSECAVATRPCPYCRVVYKRSVLPAHEASCGSRTAECEHCGKLVVRRAMEAHVAATCPALFPPDSAPSAGEGKVREEEVEGKEEDGKEGDAGEGKAQARTGPSFSASSWRGGMAGGGPSHVPPSTGAGGGRAPISKAPTTTPAGASATVSRGRTTLPSAAATAAPGTLRPASVGPRPGSASGRGTSATRATTTTVTTPKSTASAARPSIVTSGSASRVMPAAAGRSAATPTSGTGRGGSGATAKR